MSAPPELLATTEQLLASCLQQISPWDPWQVPRPLFAQETPSRPASWPLQPPRPPIGWEPGPGRPLIGG